MRRSQTCWHPCNLLAVIFLACNAMAGEHPSPLDIDCVSGEAPITSNEFMKLTHDQFHKVFEKAGRLSICCYKWGVEAQEVLKASAAPPLAKTYAALIIGKLAHIQAISILMENIDLRNPIGETGESDIGSVWPCVRALADMGIAAVPALIEAYVSENNDMRRKLISDALLFGKAYSEAETYVVGTLARTKGERERERLNALHKLVLLWRKSSGADMPLKGGGGSGAN